MSTLNSKLRIKRATLSASTPSIGPSLNPKDGNWSDTDIFSGEFFLNEINNKLYLGVGAEVKEIGLVSSANTATAPFIIESGNTSTVIPSFGSSTNAAAFSSILGGSANTISSLASYSTIVTGYQNNISSTGSLHFIGGGQYNVIANTSQRSFIGGGEYNTVSGTSTETSIIGGTSNNTGGFNNVHIIGSNITATKANTTYVEALMNDDNGTVLRKKVIDIGDWDMDATSPITVNHGLSATEWKTVKTITAIIRNDADTAYYPLSLAGINASNPPDAGITTILSATIGLSRLVGGGYDNTNFDSTSYNRGWITLEYVPDV